MIIAVTGYAQAGKDAVGKILVEQAGYERLGMGDVLRDACVALNPILEQDYDYTLRYADLLRDVGYERAKSARYPEFRAFMERLGTEFAEAIGYPELWIDTLLRDYFEDADLVMTSCRRKVEARAVVAAGGRVWRINRPGVGPVSDHPVEREMDDWEYDTIIDNDGTLEDLALKVRIALATNERTVAPSARVLMTDRELHRVDL